MTTESLCLVYVTTPTQALAERIAQNLLSEKLIACANILPAMTSLYEWKGKVQKDAEVVLLLKTRQALVPKITERVLALHEYECPCVAALPLVGGHEAFLSWISSQTSGLDGL